MVLKSIGGLLVVVVAVAVVGTIALGLLKGGLFCKVYVAVAATYLLSNYKWEFIPLAILAKEKRKLLERLCKVEGFVVTWWTVSLAGVIAFTGLYLLVEFLEFLLEEQRGDWQSFPSAYTARVRAHLPKFREGDSKFRRYSLELWERLEARRIASS